VNFSAPVKELICHMAACGWTVLPNGAFVVTSEGVRPEMVREVFGDDAIVSGGVWIVRGESARNFMALYRLAARFDGKAEKP